MWTGLEPLSRPASLCAAALAGVAAASACARPAVLLALSLVALALAARWLPLAALALGLVLGWARAAEPPPKNGAPVRLSGTIEGPWRPSPEGWRGTLRSERFRQGRVVRTWRGRVALLLPGAEPPPPGRRVRVTGIATRAPGLASQPHLRPGRWRLRLKSRRFLVAEAGRERRRPPAASAVRRRIERALDEAGPRPGAALARALLLGDAGALPGAWRRGLRAAGLAHLVALSGLHVGLLSLSCLVAGALLPRGAAPLLAAGAVLGFVLVAGPRPALLRAAAMGLAVLAALLLGRRPHGLTLLGLAALLLAAGEPALLGEAGYRLTFGATAGILWLTPRFSAAWSGLPGWLRRPLAVSVGAQLGGLPWALAAFRLMTPLAPLWNLPAVPWTALSLLGCLAWALVAIAAPPAAGVLATALDPLAWPFAALAALPPAVTRPLPLVVPLGTGVALAAGLAWLLARPRRWPWALAAAAALLAWRPAPEGPELRLLDVGQGEAVLVRDGGAAVLVDGGGWRRGDLGGRVLVPALAAAGVRRLSAVVLSHPDVDHCRGLADLVSYLPVDEVWTAPGWRRGGCVHELLTAPTTRLRLLWAGERAEIGRWRLLALHPAAGERGRGNDRSLVLAASAPGLRVLLSGDLEAAGERRLLSRWPAATLRSEVLKVGHHGSRSSSTAALLATVAPRLALISCGAGNRYGHPAAEVVARLERSGARILRTDRSGTVVLAGTGGRWAVATPAAPRPD